MPRISVIMPAYNAEKYIKEAVDSILSQTFRDFELIILNDASSDATEDIILSFDDPRIVYVKNEENLGVAGTLNRGLELAKGEYIARMDADDISLPERFEKQAAFLDGNAAVAVVGCAVERFCGEESMGVRRFSAGAEMLRIDTLFGCPLAHPGVMFRTAAIRELGGYDVAFEGLEDYALWWKVSGKWDLAALPQVLLRYRIHPGQVTQKPTKAKEQRMLLLKKGQLEALGLSSEEPLAQSFYDYCMGSRPEDKESVKTFCLYLEKIIAANESSRVYDGSLLKKYLAGVARSAVKGLPLKEVLSLCKSVKLLSFPELLLRRIMKKG